MLEEPPGFYWKRPDEMILQCVDCGEEVRAEVVDLHTCQ